MWDLPGLGHEPVSPASAGGLSTTVPPGKPPPSFLNIQIDAGALILSAGQMALKHL